MKIMLDTNVLISAFVFNGTAGKLLRLLFDTDHVLYVSEYVEQELKDKLSEKWPNKQQAVYELYKTMNFYFCESAIEQKGSLRDIKDVPVLSDALYHDVDVILTGDKDFLDAELEKPLIYSPSMMLEYLLLRGDL